MRKPFFRPLYLEQLEDRTLTNMPFGQLGTPVLGLFSVSLDNPGLDGSSLVASSAMTSNASDGQADRWLVADAGNSPAPSASPTITSGNGNPDPSANQNFRTLGNCGGCPAHFDPFAQNPFDFAFSAGKPASLVLGGAGDANMSVGNRISAGLDAGSGSSSASGGFSGGLVVTGGGNLAPGTTAQNAPMIVLPAGHMTSPVLAGSLKSSLGFPGITPALASGPLVPLCSDPLCLAAPAYVPVNADNDNNSDIAKDSHGNPATGIPTKRDFDVNPINGPQGTGDPELLQAKLTTNGLPNNGSWSITRTYNPPGALIALWTDQKKTANFFPSGLGRSLFTSRESMNRRP